jgi:uncharacterized membrane protein
MALFASAFLDVSNVSAQTSVVHAVLFYSPSCGHCHKVIREDLPPLIDKFGNQLVLVNVNVQTEEGGELFVKAIEYFNIPLDRAGVPFLVVEDISLMGSVEIPEKFPGIIEAGLIAGGIEWPQIPGLMDHLQTEGLIESEEETPATEVPPQGEQPEKNETDENLPTQDGSQNEKVSEDDLKPKDEPLNENQPEISWDPVDNEPMSMKQRFLQDVVGNSVSVLVLIGMVAAVVWVMMIVTGAWDVRKSWPIGVTLSLIVIGIAVSSYMSFVEVTHVTAVCGPVGDCNTVQQSEYAYLFGIIPVGVLGVIGYSLILVLWIIGNWGSARLRRTASIALFGLTMGGTLFSIYLTYLEPFVIGASCVWCLTSAIVMTLLMWCAAQEAALLKINSIRKTS